jgi:hypothetical protein
LSATSADWPFLTGAVIQLGGRIQGMSSTRITHHLKAPRAQVCPSLLDAGAIATWTVPTGMTSNVHEFDAWVGG